MTNACAVVVIGLRKNRDADAVLDDRAVVDEQHAIGEAARLCEIVRRHDKGDALRFQRRDHLLDLARGAGIELGCRLVEEQQFRAKRPCARDREALLLAARQEPRGALRNVLKPESAQRLVGALRSLRVAHGGEGVREIGAGGAAQHHGLLEHHRVPLAPVAHAAGRAPRDGARAWRNESVAHPEEERLARAVGAEDRGQPACGDVEVGRGQQPAFADAKARLAPLERKDRGSGVRPMVEHHGAPAKRAPMRLAPNATAFTASVSAMSVIPRPSARARSPLEVSSAMDVVITRV